MGIKTDQRAGFINNVIINNPVLEEYEIPDFQMISPVQQLTVDAVGEMIAAGISLSRPIGMPISPAADDGLSENLVMFGKTVGETPSEALDRRTKQFYHNYPITKVFEHLNLVEMRFTLLTDKNENEKRSATWCFREECRLTKAGEKLWMHSNHEINDLAIPFARRELLTVTDIQIQDEDLASVKFIWRLKLDFAGLTFDSSSAEFKRLPDNLQTQLSTDGFAQRMVDQHNILRNGIADFVRNETGWKLIDITYQEL